MRIDRRLVLIGVMVIVLSMTMATQYATTRIGYEFAIVHPSDADIRFIGSDNSSDGIRVLRVENNDTAQQVLKIVLGNITLNTNKTYTAAFGIVNEESYNITITHINVSTSDTDYMQIWLHENRSALATVSGEHSVLVWNKEEDLGYDATSSVWGLAAGNQDPSDMGTGATILTPWDGTASVRYNSTSDVSATNNTQDHVWVQISIDIPGGDIIENYSGTIFVHTRATTHDE